MPGDQPFDSFDRGGRHPITFAGPADDFFEGALLGNGGLGCVVVTRPNTLLLHFGHNNVWDFRIAEDHAEEIGTFREVFDRVSQIDPNLEQLEDDPWYAEYLKMTQENYRKPYPRPFPCGTVCLGFDRREAEVLGHTLDIRTGECSVHMRTETGDCDVHVFVDQSADRLYARATTKNGGPHPSPFHRIRLYPDPETPTEFPPFEPGGVDGEGRLWFRQVLPAEEPERYDPDIGHPDDRAIRLIARVNRELEERTRSTWRGTKEQSGPLDRQLAEGEAFELCVALEEGPVVKVDAQAPLLSVPSEGGFEKARQDSEAIWQTYWERSGVVLDDADLERAWYHNLYFLNCAARSGKTCPGLFANWSLGKIGSSWHGDYHMNYNTQQPFWVCFSSNHVDQHLVYVEMVETHLMPIGKKWAKTYYEMPGAFFPHTGYPVPMAINPYPVPHWGWEVCETPWTVQSLWWHYAYTQDLAFLRDRAFGPIKAATEFLTAYILRPEARGERWKDDRYHIFPTVPPELYGLRPGFEFNADCLVDLTLTRFVLKAFEEACGLLGIEEEAADLLGQTADVLAHLPDYAQAESERGRVFVSVEGEDPETVYNVPLSTMTVFPGEEHGLHSSPEELEIARNTYRNHRNEGGNDLVFYNLQGARLGILDLERFKRQMAYCLLPNGTFTNMALSSEGRYRDLSNYGFMKGMGIWFENFALPVVINECLLQSYTGTLRFFPNWPDDSQARFQTLRAVGGFLVSAAFVDGAVQWIEVKSEAGKLLRMHNPWSGPFTLFRGSEHETVSGEVVELATVAGEILRLESA